MEFCQVGESFGKLTIISQRAGVRQPLIDTYVCRCFCGALTEASGGQLRSGKKLSCGCSHAEAHARNFRRHGQAHTRLYDVWVQILGRCQNPKHPRYADYGGRGITVDPAWHSFENFLADMGPPPAGHQLDRRKNEEGYSKGNCHWTTSKRNNRNRRTTLKVDFEGQLLPVGDIADLFGLPYETVRSRARRGLPVTTSWCAARKGQK